MEHEAHTSHTNPGFGKNTGGWGIVIVAIVAALLAMIAWWLWNHGSMEKKHYRLSEVEATHDEHGEGHGETASTAAFKIEDPATLGTIDPAGNFIYHVGDTVALKLPDGSYMKVGDRSTEARLLKFLTDKGMEVNMEDKTQGWITCDRIFFETGKADLTQASLNQINNLASILKAFPEATIKVGGYTDNTGDNALNQKLSGERAEAVRQAIVAAGGANAAAAEGYGSEWALASNETEEGKAINRRVDIRVTKK